MGERAKNLPTTQKVYARESNLVLERDASGNPCGKRKFGLVVGAAERIFGALGCGHDGVMAEAARLLTRMWAPAAARTGAGPWQISRSSAASAVDSDTAANITYEETMAARAAKSAFLQNHAW